MIMKAFVSTLNIEYVVKKVMVHVESLKVVNNKIKKTIRAYSSYEWRWVANVASFNNYQGKCDKKNVTYFFSSSSYCSKETDYLIIAMKERTIYNGYVCRIALFLRQGSTVRSWREGKKSERNLGILEEDMEKKVSRAWQ